MKNKIISLVSFAAKLCSAVVALGQSPVPASPSTNWGLSLGEGFNKAVFRDVFVLPSGEAVTVGNYEGYRMNIGRFQITSVGLKDALIVKTTSSGSPLWVRSIGGAFMDEAVSVVVDSLGTTYVAGIFEQTMIAGSDTLISQGGTDIFIAALDNSGRVQWAKSFGGQSDDYAVKMVLGKGRIYLAINTQGGFFISGKEVKSSITATGVFVEVDYRGTLLNRIQLGGNGIKSLFSLVYDQRLGRLGFCGVYESRVEFLSQILTTPERGSTFYGWLNPEFTQGRIWHFTSDISIGCRDLLFDSIGGMYLVGYMHGRVKFGTQLSIQAVNREGFLAKTSTLGRLEWFKRIKGEESGHEIRCIEREKRRKTLMISGLMSGSSTVFFDKFTISHEAGVNSFVGRVTLDGDLKWIKPITGSAYDAVQGMSVDSLGNTFICGEYTSRSLTVSPITLTTTAPQSGFLVSVPFNTPPTTTGIRDVYRKANAVNDTLINLYDCFDDEETPDPLMRYRITGNTNLGLFRRIFINKDNRLVIGIARDSVGAAQITVQATDEDGASVSTTFQVRVEKITGLEDNSSFTTIQIYPNPAHDFVEVDIASPFQFCWWNSEGKRLTCGISMTSRLKTSELQKGMYLLQINTHAGTFVSRVVIE